MSLMRSAKQNTYGRMDSEI